MRTEIHIASQRALAPRPLYWAGLTAPCRTGRAFSREPHLRGAADRRTRLSDRACGTSNPVGQLRYGLRPPADPVGGPSANGLVERRNGSVESAWKALREALREGSSTSAPARRLARAARRARPHPCPAARGGSEAARRPAEGQPARISRYRSTRYETSRGNVTARKRHGVGHRRVGQLAGQPVGHLHGLYWLSISACSDRATSPPSAPDCSIAASADRSTCGIAAGTALGLDIWISARERRLWTSLAFGSPAYGSAGKSLLAGRSLLANPFSAGWLPIPPCSSGSRRSSFPCSGALLRVRTASSRISAVM
jgi:hypothetical protein